MCDRPPARVAIIAGALSGAVCLLLTHLFGLGAGDFRWCLRAARDLLAGRDPYAHAVTAITIPYPLPAAFIGIPFTILPEFAAGAVFIGLSVGLLVWGFVRANELWRLGMLFSWPFIYSVCFAQWPPLLCALWFFPSAAPLILAKPHMAFPLVMTNRITKSALCLTAAVLTLSFLLYPTWPWVWFSQISGYQGVRPPILNVPLGPLLLFSFLEWRDRRAWLLFTMACMPQRMFYDQMALLLVARNGRELQFLVMCAWIGFAALWLSDGLANMPGSWQLWILLSNYLPALGVLLRPHLRLSVARYRPAAP
jgi:hypothetical protein